ncbi:hypothetical protein [Arthrobacter oryzae]|jgi:hypothetical protein|uniref:hypothetical protein n=1 Tax=Arthrobacter oryzae TaxID=409290 RepID=UPI002785BA84|nr:hypothetical protein [Arthrobacter oryzae]MDQ0079372.1 hypothetical protein [Arthrobacter oryzae]
MDEQQLADIAAALYRLPLEEFVTARTAAAKAAAADSGRAPADDVRALPKPSAAAWAVNMLAVHRPGPLRELEELGALMRSAQGDLDAGALRSLAQERRQLLNRVMDAARTVAEEHGRKLSGAVATEVEQTLRAATVDEGAATAVRSGRLLRVLSADGVDSVDLHDAVAVPSVLTLPAVPAPEAVPASESGQASESGKVSESGKAVEAPGKSKGRATKAGTPAADAPAAASAEKPRLKAVRTERPAPTPSAVERAAARLAEAEEAARSAAEEARLRTAEFEEAEADMTRLGDEARSLRERLKVVDSQFEQARKRREATAAQKQLAARAAEKGQRAEVLARERVLRLRNTPD